VNRRLVKTSQGWVVLQAQAGRIAGLSVHVAVFGPDGWQSDGEGWNARYNEGQSLVDVLEKVAKLPREEADQLAADFLREWKERGFEEEERKEERRSSPTSLARSAWPLSAWSPWSCLRCG
jgi:hypothetical protein